MSTPSIGIALFLDDADDLETLLKRSDHAMYRAKAAGGARFFDWKQDKAKDQPGLFDIRALRGMPEPVARNSPGKSIDNNIDSTAT